MARGDRRGPLAPTSAGNGVPISATAVQPQRGKSVRKNPGGTGQDPSIGTAAHRGPEMMGAKRRIDINLPGPQSPEAGQTLANARLLPAVMGSKNNFYDQATRYGVLGPS